MFKNLTIYRVLAGWPTDADTLDTTLQAASFLPCESTQERSVGWVEPRGHAHGPMVEVIDGQWLLKLMVETKTVPGPVLARKVQEYADQIESNTGRKPGKKERGEIADDARLELLPMAFPKQTSALVWFDSRAGLLMIDGPTDDALTALIRAVGGLALQLVSTRITPASAMVYWLAIYEAPSGFSIGRECELEAYDESRAVVWYGRHALDTDEVRDHIRAGKIPTRLALTWNDRVSFVLTDGMQLRKITVLGAALEDRAAADAFDADAAIFTGELRKLIPDLLEALGGEVRALPPLPGGAK